MIFLKIIAIAAFCKFLADDLAKDKIEEARREVESIEKEKEYIQEAYLMMKSHNKKAIATIYELRDSITLMEYQKTRKR